MQFPYEDESVRYNFFIFNLGFEPGSSGIEPVPQIRLNGSIWRLYTSYYS